MNNPLLKSSKVFQEMLDQPEIQDNDIFTIVEQYQCRKGKEETQKAIEMLKNNKAAGENVIGAKLLKKGELMMCGNKWRKYVNKKTDTSRIEGNSNKSNK